MGRYGRKAGFLVGGGFAISGGLVCTVALIRSNFGLLCLGHLFLGAALACYQYFRFAAAEIASGKWQPVAISPMLTSTVQESGLRKTPATALAILRRKPVLSAVIAGAIVASYSWTLLCLAAIPVVLLALFSLLMNRSVKLI